MALRIEKDRYVMFVIYEIIIIILMVASILISKDITRVSECTPSFSDTLINMTPGVLFIMFLIPLVRLWK